MFLRLPLSTSFEFVASPSEWEKFRSFGEVTGNDLWINALAVSPGQPDRPGKLDGYEWLRSTFLTRVHDKLRSGEWIAEAFHLSKGPELQLIEPELWSVLEFDPFEDEAFGAGFRFVGMVLSASQDRPAPKSTMTPGSTRRRLNTFLRKIATEERTPVRRVDLLREAKAALGDNSITLTLLDECVRSNELGDVLLVRGRPPA